MPGTDRVGGASRAGVESALEEGQHPEFRRKPLLPEDSQHVRPIGRGLRVAICRPMRAPSPWKCSRHRSTSGRASSARVHHGAAGGAALSWGAATAHSAATCENAMSARAAVTRESPSVEEAEALQLETAQELRGGGGGSGRPSGRQQHLRPFELKSQVVEAGIRGALRPGGRRGRRGRRGGRAGGERPAEHQNEGQASTEDHGAGVYQPARTAAHHLRVKGGDGSADNEGIAEEGIHVAFEDYRMKAQVRAILVRRWVDLSKLEYSVTNGVIYLRGSLRPYLTERMKDSNQERRCRAGDGDPPRAVAAIDPGCAGCRLSARSTEEGRLAMEGPMSTSRKPVHRSVLDPDLVRLLDDEAERHPEWPDVQNRLGLSLFARGRLTEAESRFERCLEMNPRYAWATLNLAQCLAVSGKTERARVGRRRRAGSIAGRRHIRARLRGAGRRTLRGRRGAPRRPAPAAFASRRFPSPACRARSDPAMPRRPTRCSPRPASTPRWPHSMSPPGTRPTPAPRRSSPSCPACISSGSK